MFCCEWQNPYSLEDITPLTPVFFSPHVAQTEKERHNTTQPLKAAIKEGVFKEEEAAHIHLLGINMS